MQHGLLSVLSAAGAARPRFPLFLCQEQDILVKPRKDSHQKINGDVKASEGEVFQRRCLFGVHGDTIAIY